MLIMVFKVFLLKCEFECDNVVLGVFALGTLGLWVVAGRALQSLVWSITAWKKIYTTKRIYNTCTYDYA